MWSSTRGRATTLVTLLALLAGCGGSASETPSESTDQRPAISDTLNAFSSAGTHHQGELACSLLAADLQDEFETRGGEATPGGGCADVILQDVVAVTTFGAVLRLPYGFDDIEVDGGTALVSPDDFCAVFSFENGKWVISGLPIPSDNQYIPDFESECPPMLGQEAPS